MERTSGEVMERPSGVHPEIRVETVSDYQSFLDLEPVWSELVQEAGIDHPFLEHAWVRTWWECFGANSRLHILVARAGERPVGIAPLIWNQARICGITVRRLGFFFNPHVPHADFIVAQGADEVGRAFWSHLLASSDWDVVQLCELRAGSRTAEELAQLAALDGCHVGVWPSNESPYLPLSATWDQYFNSISARHRRNVRNRLKRLGNIGPLEMETITSDRNLEDCLNAGFRLEASGWKESSGTAIACDPDLRKFYTILARRAAGRGWLELQFLKVGGERVAFGYSLFYKNKIHLLKAGYDPAYAKYSPFVLLLSLILQSAYQRGVSQYDFLGTNEEWKQIWTRQTDPHHWLFIFRDTLRGRLLHQVKFRLIPRLKHYRFLSSLRDRVVLSQGFRLVHRLPARRVAPVYVPAWPGLTPGNLLPSKADQQPPFPLNNPRRIAFCVARSGIYHLFRALRFQPGETVLVPDYHSGNEVFAIRAAGIPITFYPVRRSLEPDLEALYRLVNQGARALYVIHYLGWPQPMREITALCRQRGLLLIEDCALSLLSEADGQPLGSAGDYSIFCLYKTLPVPNGGLLVMNRSVPPELENLHLEPCPSTAAAGRSIELMLEALRSRWNGPGRALFTLKRAAGRALRGAGAPHVPVGDIGWNPKHVNLGMSSASNRIMRGLDYGQIRNQRRENFLLLREKLEGCVRMLRDDLSEGVCPLFFPILVKDKHEVAKALWQRGIGAVEFWNQGDSQANGDGSSEAQYLRDHVLELPIHQGVTAAGVEYMAEQLKLLDL